MNWPRTTAPCVHCYEALTIDENNRMGKSCQCGALHAFSQHSQLYEVRRPEGASRSAVFSTAMIVEPITPTLIEGKHGGVGALNPDDWTWDGKDEGPNS